VRSNENNVEDSWWQEGEESDQNGADSSSSGSQESFRSPSKTASSKSHSMSFFSSKSESSEGVVFVGNADESVLQFGDLLDTEVQFSMAARIRRLLQSLSTFSILNHPCSFVVYCHLFVFLSVLVSYHLQVSFNLVVLYVTKIAQNTVNELF